MSSAQCEWQKIRLRFLLKRTPTKEQRQKLLESPQVSFLPMEAISEQGEIDLSVIRDQDDVKTGYTLFFDDDVIIAKITPCFENGKGALVKGLLNSVGYGTTELYVLSPGVKIDGKFLYYITVSEPFRKIGEANMTGAAGQKRVPEDFVRNYRIGLPSLPEQQAIVDCLDLKIARLDDLVAAKERLLELLKEKRKALITHAVTRGLDPHITLFDSGVDWIGNCPEHWTIAPVKHGFDLIGSGTTPPTENSQFYGGNVYWVTTSELRENIIFSTNQTITQEALSEFTSLKVYPAGTLLFAMYGATIGRVAILGTPATVNQAVCSLAGSNLFDPWYAFYSFQASRDYLCQLATGGGQPNLNSEKVREHRLPCPPVNEQKAIVAYIDRETEKIDSLHAATENTIALLKERREALIAAAVTGKIKVG
ncbi:restriction endonuclease subunit S [Methanosarcina mazei]|uniref:Type I restriction modification DNA specificity domain-containing protein n=1 Tax=Methanosarcina mazei TaxID=2209 RepID=A0A0F8HB95_METMZ|nr:restriction endonuclease subunit S [Methanosarcina mazei]KKG64154.1 hypothetical protein DU67_12125 [Methanosarcina mazei]